MNAIAAVPMPIVLVILSGSNMVPHEARMSVVPFDDYAALVWHVFLRYRLPVFVQDMIDDGAGNYPTSAHSSQEPL